MDRMKTFHNCDYIPRFATVTSQNKHESFLSKEKVKWRGSDLCRLTLGLLLTPILINSLRKLKTFHPSLGVGNLSEYSKANTEERREMSKNAKFMMGSKMSCSVFSEFIRRRTMRPSFVVSVSLTLDVFSILAIELMGSSCTVGPRGSFVFFLR